MAVMFILIVLSLIAGSVARATANHSLVLAAALVVASPSWASPASAADAPDAWITTKVKMASPVAEDVRRATDRDGPGQPDRLTAFTLARTTHGVRSVVGDPTVKAAQ